MKFDFYKTITLIATICLGVIAIALGIISYYLVSGIHVDAAVDFSPFTSLDVDFEPGASLDTDVDFKPYTTLDVDADVDLDKYSDSITVSLQNTSSFY